MSFNDCKISESQIQTTGVQSQPDTLTGSAADNKMVFDALPTLAIQKLNSLIDQMQQQAAAGQVGVTPFEGMTAQTLQAALEQIHADIGGNYSGADGAGKVGYTPSEGVDEDTVQAAIEAVQANLTAYIAKIKAATGAAEVGNAPIAGMTATNVQQALEELRENIDNIVSGIIPGGSITNDMLQGPVSIGKGGTGATTPQGALANLGGGVRPNLLINPFFEVNQRGQTSYSGTYGVYTVDGWLLNNAETATVNVLSNGVQIVAGTVTAQFRQYLESLPDGVYTLSFLFTDGSLGYAVYEKSGTTYTRKDYTPSNVWGFGMQDTSGKPTAYMYVQAGMSAAPVASKLESGEGQTLAYQDDTGAWQLLPQPESDYATQLAKCQRYLLLSIAGDYRASYISTNAIIFVVPIPVTMRVSPTRIGDFLVKTITGSTQTGFAFSIAARSGCIRISATKTAHGLTDAILNIQSNVDGFTAEL